MSMSDRHTYVENMKQELDELYDQLNDLEAKLTHMAQDGRERHAADLQRLHRHARAALAKWQELQASGEEGWHQKASDMDRMRDVLIHAFHDLKARL